MYILCKWGVFLGFVVISFSFGMETVRVKTLADNRVMIIEQWKVKQSSVLGLVQAYQKKNKPYAKYIIVPKNCLLCDAIKKNDIVVFSKFLDHQGHELKNYFDNVSTEKKRTIIRAMGVLGATALSAQLVDYYFPPDIVRLIVSKIIGSELESHLIKKVIKNNDGYEPIKMNPRLYEFTAPQLSSFYKAMCFKKTINLINAIAYCCNDQRLVICVGNCIAVWACPLHKSYARLKKINIEDSECVINSIVVYEKTGKIVVGATNGKLYMVDICCGRQVALLEGHKKSPINGMSRNDTHGIIVSSTNDIGNNLMVWDGENGDRLAHLIGHPGVTKARISKDGQYIISRSPRGIRKWELYPDSVRDMIDNMKNQLNCVQAQSLHSLCKAIKDKTIISENKKEYAFLQKSFSDVQIKEFLEKYLV